MFVGILLACIWLVSGTPLDPLTPIPNKAITKGSYVRYYTTAHYDTAQLREHRARTRREGLAKPASRRKEPTLNLHVNALDRTFKLRLVRDTTLYHKEAVFEASNGRTISFDPAHTYTGTLEGNKIGIIEIADIKADQLPLLIGPIGDQLRYKKAFDAHNRQIRLPYISAKS